MYQDYFGLNNAPFSIVPDHRVVYMSDSHRDAVAHLLYSLKQSGGFVQLTGEVGTGKTTVCRYLLQHLPERVDVALLLNPRINEKEMIETICDELVIDYPDGATLKQLLTELNISLLASHAGGRHTVLIIDEAQNLSREVLEQIRLLTNLETSTDKLLQIILIGQPELVRMLARHDLRQLSQRIVGRFKLEPLNLKETREYIGYRLRQAGCERPLFTSAASRLIHKLSKGIPRVINVLCDTALMGAYSQDSDKVSRGIVSTVAQDIVLTTHHSRPKTSWLRFAGVATVLLLAIASVIRFGDVDGLKQRIVRITSTEPANRIEIEAAPAKQTTSQPDTEKLSGSETAQGSDPVQTNPAGQQTDVAINIPAEPDPAQTKLQVPGVTLPNSPDDGRNESSRFDLIYRLGVPYRTE